MLARNKDLQLLLHGFSFYLGMYVLTLVCLDQLLKDNLSQSNIGWIGFTYVSCEIFGIFVSGVIVNKFKCFCFTFVGRNNCFTFIFQSTSLHTVWYLVWLEFFLWLSHRISFHISHLFIREHNWSYYVWCRRVTYTGIIAGWLCF